MRSMKKKRRTMSHAQAMREQLLGEKRERAEIRAAYNAERKAKRKGAKAKAKLADIRRKGDAREAKRIAKERDADRRAQRDQLLGERIAKREAAEETLQRLRDHSISRDMFFDMLEDEGFTEDESYEVLHEY